MYHFWHDLFIIGESSEYLNFEQNITCPVCSKNGILSILVEYTSLKLDSFPIFKWNKRYFVQINCCKSYSPIDNPTGKLIVRGEIDELDLQKLSFSHISSDSNNAKFKKCKNCGYESFEKFEFCPKCGSSF